MDPLSITTGIIGLIQVSSKIIYQCYEYKRILRSRAKDAPQLIEQLNSLRDMLEKILLIADDDGATRDPRLPTIAAICAPNGVLNVCETKLTELQQKLEPAQGWKAPFDILLWPLKEKDTTAATQDISRMIGYLQLALSIDQTASIMNIQDGVDKIGEQMETSLSIDETDKIISWLGAFDPAKIQNELRKKSHPKTGEWFVESDLVDTWKEQEASFFWLYGIPGCGKTVISSTLIDRLERECSKATDLALAYYYLDFNNSPHRSAESLLKSLVVQLSTQTEAISDHLRPAYKEHQNGKRQPSTSCLASLVSQLVQKFESVYVVIDALDEGENMEEVMRTVQDLRRFSLPQLHILVSSRELLDIQRQLATSVTQELRLQESLIPVDIAVYIRTRLREDWKLSQFPTDIIEKALLDNANGMFRWVDCQLSNLANCFSFKDIERELLSLPESLDETYERILEQVPPIHRKYLRRILEWLAFAGRPVEIHELMEVLAIDEQDKLQYDADARPLRAEHILRLGSSLVTTTSTTVQHFNRRVAYDYYDLMERDVVEEIRLAHLSVKDYLLSDRIRCGSARDFALDARLSNSVMANTCLIYLLRKPFQCGYDDDLSYDEDHERLKSKLQKWPFLHYAAHFWPHHVVASGNEIPAKTWMIMQRFFATRELPDCGNYAFWVLILAPTMSKYAVESSTPLYYAASFGLTSVIKRILASEGEDVVHQTGGRYESTPLQVASFRGHLDAVKLLLDAGADFSWSYGSEGGPLYLAICRGSVGIVDILISHGATLSQREAKNYVGLMKMYGVSLASMSPKVLKVLNDGMKKHDDDHLYVTNTSTRSPQQSTNRPT